MNRDWIRNPNRVTSEYLSGIKEFLEIASKYLNNEGYTKCPCQKCNNCRFGTLRDIRLHLATNGMSYSYTTWTHHGERRRYISSSTAIGPISDNGGAIGCDKFRRWCNMYSRESDNFKRLLKEAQRELYPGCKDFSVLTSVVELMHCKVMSLMSNRCFNHLLGIIKRLLPKPNNLPESHYEANKILKGLGLGYEKMHACKYDFTLFYKENKGLDECPICNEPRYHKSSWDNKRKVPRKFLRYFPLKPRLQRLYMSIHTAGDIRWHKEGRVDDEVMRHPADGTAWNEFDKLYLDFAADPRNVRLGLATNGFNPFNNMSKPYSIWPVLVVPYNLPPWRCMKKEFSKMALIIPGDKAS